MQLEHLYRRGQKKAAESKKLNSEVNHKNLPVLNTFTWMFFNRKYLAKAQIEIREPETSH